MPALNNCTRAGEESFFSDRFREQFPAKLYEMLEHPSSSAIKWLPHGRAFRILNEREFLQHTIPVFFKITKLRSFYRQLNLWGFKRVTRGSDKGTWYHDHFIRGVPQEMRKMIRIKIKGTKASRGRLDNKKDPDFYSLPPSSPPQTTTCWTNDSAFVGSAAISARAPQSIKPLPLTNDEIYDAALSTLSPQDLSVIRMTAKATVVEPLPYDSDASFDVLAGCVDKLGSLLW